MADPQDELRDELTKLRAELTALRERLARLEQGQSLHNQPQATQQRFASPPALETEIPQQPSRRLQLLNRSASPSLSRGQLEGQIGKFWLNRIGIIAILTGASYFISYAFDSGWIGPKAKIAAGLAAGIGLILWSERLRARGQVPFSYTLKALGIGTLYLSVWGAFQSYHLIPVGLAFAAMVLISGGTKGEQKGTA